MNRSAAWLGAAVCGLLALLGVLGIASAKRADVGRVYHGVHVGDVDLSNLTRTEATAKLTTTVDAITDQPLTLRVGDQQWRLTPSGLGARFDVPGTVAAAYAVGREGNPLARLETVFSNHVVSTSVSARYQIDDSKLQDAVHQVGAAIDQPLRDAGVTIVGTQVHVTHAQPGRKLDVDATIAQLRDRIGSLSTAPIDLTVAVTAPSLTDDQVADAATQATHWLDHDVTVQAPDGNSQITKAQIAGMVRFLQQDNLSLIHI